MPLRVLLAEDNALLRPRFRLAASGGASLIWATGRGPVSNLGMSYGAGPTGSPT
ncbi:MAG: hypothetical protein IPH03_18575 [Tetrasphaera sp.]|nr:hypothetical protein [Tetrasphaera sp.]